MKITETSREMNPVHWLAVKPLTPFGQLPVLEIKSDDGQVTQIAETGAISKLFYQSITQIHPKLN